MDGHGGVPRPYRVWLRFARAKLLIAQGRHGIDVSSSTRGDVAGDKGRQKED